MNRLAALLTLGIREIRRTWSFQESITAVVFFLAAGVASGWWSTKELAPILGIRLALLAVTIGLPGGVFRALQVENRSFLQRQPIEFGVRVTHISLLATVRSALMVFPMGLGFAVTQREGLGLSLFGLVGDSLLLVVALFMSSWLGAACTDLVDPRAAFWPWRMAGKNMVSSRMTRNPLSALQIASIIRAPAWIGITLLNCGLAVGALLIAPANTTEVLMLVPLMPTLLIIDQMASDTALPFMATFPGALARWLSLRVLTSTGLALPASLVVLFLAFVGQRPLVEYTLYAVFGAVTAICAISTAAVLGCLRWSPSSSWFARATNWMAGVGVWGVAAVLVSLFTLPPSLRHPIGLGIAVGLGATILAAVRYVRYACAKLIEGRDWRGARN